jgi:hypothetical protein
MKTNWKNARFRLREWDWFKLRLDLEAVRARSELLSFDFEFRDILTPRILRAYGLPSEVEVICRVFGAHCQRMVEENAPRSEQLEYYRDWVEAQKELIEKILAELPVLRRRLRLDKHFAFVIMYNYGMGASEVCRFIGSTLTWSAPPKSEVTSNSTA